MRTRTLLLAVAALAASLVTSQAQVFSQNVVGYINITLKPGYNLIANQLINGTNGIAQVFPTVPDNSTLVKWNFAGQTFANADQYISGVWYDQSFNNASTRVNPGEGVFIHTDGPGDTVITLTGQVTTGNNLTVNIQAPGYGFYSSIVPDGSTLPAAGLVGSDNMTYQTYDPATGYSAALQYISGSWYDQGFNVVNPQPNVGQGFVLHTDAGGSTTWTRNFNP